jgi:hypothetical protein
MRLLSYSNVMATVAVFVALSGSSYAAISLRDNSVKSRHIAKGQVRSSDVADGSLVAGDFHAGLLAAASPGAVGPPGPSGAQGPTGPQGEPATRLFAAIAEDGTLLHGNGVTKSVMQMPGQYRVTFDRSLEHCVATSGYYAKNVVAAPNMIDHFALAQSSSKPDTLHVSVWNSAKGVSLSVPFAIVAFC